MEFLLLAVLGLATFGMRDVMSPEEEESGQSGKNGSSKNSKDKDANKDKKTAKQKLIEAIAEYEAENHSGETRKILYEIAEK